MSDEDLRNNYLYLVEMDTDNTSDVTATESLQENTALRTYLADNFSKEERENLRDTKYFYEIIFEKPGGLVMPILAELTYEDGSVENKYYPAEIWRFNDKEVKKVLGSEKRITGIKIDPNGLTADVNTDNNSWPREKSDSKFESFKKKSLSN